MKIFQGLSWALDRPVVKSIFHEDDELPLKAKAHGYYRVQAISLLEGLSACPRMIQNYSKTGTLSD